MKTWRNCRRHGQERKAGIREYLRRFRFSEESIRWMRSWTKEFEWPWIIRGKPELRALLSRKSSPPFVNEIFSELARYPCATAIRFLSISTLRFYEEKKKIIIKNRANKARPRFLNEQIYEQRLYESVRAVNFWRSRNGTRFARATNLARFNLFATCIADGREWRYFSFRECSWIVRACKNIEKAFIQDLDSPFHWYFRSRGRRPRFSIVENNFFSNDDNSFSPHAEHLATK